MGGKITFGAWNKPMKQLIIFVVKKKISLHKSPIGPCNSNSITTLGLLFFPLLSF